MYNNTTTRVVSPDSSTDYLKTLSGVLQGDTLALYPFIILTMHFEKVQKIMKTWDLH